MMYFLSALITVITLLTNAADVIVESTDHFGKDSSFECAKITPSVIKAAITSSNGSKANYFRFLQNITSLSRVGPAFSTSAQRVHSIQGRKSKVLFLGDSIVRELSESFGRLRTGSYFRYTKVMRWIFAPDYNIQAGLQSYIRDTRRGGPFNTVFVGGLGVHFLLRNNNSLLVDLKESPVELHRFLVRTYLAAWADLSSELDTQLIFVGTIPLEAALMHLYPPKGDWAAFFDFSLAEIWADIDSVEYQRLVDSWPLSMKLNPPLQFFNPAQLAQRCGAIRCDGMHFASQFAKEYGCYPSAFLWESEIAEFLVSNFPRTWGLI